MYAHFVDLVNLRSFSTIPEVPLYILHQKSRFWGIFVDINKIATHLFRNFNAYLTLKWFSANLNDLNDLNTIRSSGIENEVYVSK